MRFLVLGLLALIAACQPLARPFLPESKALAPSQLSALGPRSGIVVAAPAGANAAVAALLPQRVAAALRERQVPATARADPRRRFALLSDVRTRFVRDDTVEVAVRWTLRDPQGAVLTAWDQSMSADGAAWRLADPLVIEAFAAVAALELAARIGSGELESAQERRSGPVSLAIAPVFGAPGDGNESLARALADTLRLRGVEVGAIDQNVTFFVSGGVTVSLVAGGERIDIVWGLLRADGQEVGTVDQSNVLAPGALDGAWEDVAYAIAEGAADGILALLKRPEAARARSTAK